MKKYMDARKKDKNSKIKKEEEKKGDNNFLDLMKFYQTLKKNKDDIKNIEVSTDDECR